jgi:hypothetical protein
MSARVMCVGREGSLVSLHFGNAPKPDHFSRKSGPKGVKAFLFNSSFFGLA